jgi:chromosome partitioning protein
MPVIAVINRKGGSGKSTLATHLAAYYASARVPVVLGDVDRQQSTQSWLSLRAAHTTLNRPPIKGWCVDPKTFARPPTGIEHVVLDTPGGLRGFELARVVMYTDAIVMPVCNSVFDRDSAAECLAELKTLPRVSSGRCKIAAVGMRLDARTKAEAVLREWAAFHQIEFLGVLRETQGYVRCIERGLALFDLPTEKVRSDLAQWEPMLRWLTASLPVAATEHCDEKKKVATPQMSVQRPVLPASRPVAVAVEPRIVPTPAQPNASGPREERLAVESAATRVSRLLDALPIPRFLQRTP